MEKCIVNQGRWGYVCACLTYKVPFGEEKLIAYEINAAALTS